MPTLSRPHGAIEYHVRGSGSPPVLLTHGYGASSAMFSRNLAALSTANQVVTWDLRGHGGSASPADPAGYAAAAARADLAALLDQLGHDRAVLGGHSLGGYLSLDFALSWPDRVAGLVLLGTGPGFRNEAARADWNRRAEMTADRLAEQGIQALRGSPDLDGDQHRDAAGLILAARHTLTQHDSHVLDGLPRIAVPTLIIVGSADAAFHGAADYMAAKIPAARKVVIDAAGHAPNVDQPARFDAEVCAFLADVTAAEHQQ
jgi:pimeloyl-ACP methyl ester carboxylesterase